jgi:hypothetical protein
MGVSGYPVMYGTATFRSTARYQTQEIISECYQEERGESLLFTCETCSLDRKCQSNEMAMTQEKINLKRIQISHIFKSGSFSSNDINTINIRISPPILRHSRTVFDRLCGLVVRVSGYRSRGPRFDYRPYQIFWEVGSLERDPLSLVRTTEELPEWKSSGSGLENRD